MPLDTETGNPAPLGLAVFGMTTIFLSIFNAGLLPAAGEVLVWPLALFVGGIPQLFAGIMEYRDGNTFGTVAFNAYGAFWIWLGAAEILGAAGILDLSAEGVTTALGVSLVLWGVFTLYMWVATFRLNWGLWIVFLTLTVTFFLLGFGDWFGMPTLATWGGWLGILTGLLAWYVSFAEVTNWAFARTVLPLGSAPISAGSEEPPAEPAD
ncbi:MAG TPA: acetate uptake transporter [Halococcus sp.]|nr:acetate uptake transporter [Halococcus sp.]